jgi:hypothetical protein
MNPTDGQWVWNRDAGCLCRFTRLAVSPYLDLPPGGAALTPFLAGASPCASGCLEGWWLRCRLGAALAVAARARRACRDDERSVRAAQLLSETAGLGCPCRDAGKAFPRQREAKPARRPMQYGGACPARRGTRRGRRWPCSINRSAPEEGRCAKSLQACLRYFRLTSMTQYTQDDVEMADRQIAEAECHIVQQEALITHLRMQDHSTQDADEMLKVFNSTLVEHRNHRAAIIEALETEAG